MTARTCRTCVYAASLEVDGKTVLICANRPDSPGRPVCICPEGTCRRYFKDCGPRPRTPRVVPPPPPNDEVRYIGLTKGRFAIVDAADYEELSQYRWHSHHSRNGSGYARRGSGTSAVLMHRQLMDPPEGMVVDHIDGNGLNNRRANLRVCTPRENQINRGPTKARRAQGQFKGVYFREGNPRPHVSIRFKGKDIHVGVFDTEIEAARAYDRQALELFGEFAYLNFPQDHGRPPNPPDGPREGMPQEEP